MNKVEFSFTSIHKPCSPPQTGEKQQSGENKTEQKQRHSSGQRCMKPCDRNVTERRLTLCSKLCFCKIIAIFLNKTKYFSLNVNIHTVNRNEGRKLTLFGLGRQAGHFTIFVWPYLNSTETCGRYLREIAQPTQSHIAGPGQNQNITPSASDLNV